MRKLFLALVSCIALVAFMGFSATASAIVVEDDCDLALGGDGPYNNDFAVYDFEIIFPDSMVEYEVSGLIGKGVLCGSAVNTFAENLRNCGNPGETPPIGVESFLNEVEVTVPPGVIMNAEGFGVPGAYLGNANANAISCSLRNVLPNQAVKTIAKVNETYPADDCPDNPSVITCMLGDSDLGFAYMWHTVTGQDSQGRDLYTLTIGPFHSLLGDAGLTKLNSFTFCAYAGEVGGTDCGTVDSNPDGWLQINGDAAAPDCNGGAGPEGIYTARAKRNLGDWTASVDWCAAWTPFPFDGLDVRLTSVPDKVTLSDSATFKFTSNAPANTTYRCKLGYDSEEVNCDSGSMTYENLETDKSYNFFVRSSGPNSSRSYDNYQWKVLSEIDTTITSRPSKTSRDATFEYTSFLPEGQFKCTLDDGAEEECNGGSKTYQNLSVDEDHNFSVYATGALGDDATPATHTWSIPSVRITSGPPEWVWGGNASTDATFEFTSPVAGATFKCILDGGAEVDCNSGSINYQDLSLDEEHTFSVEANWPGGESNTTSDTYSWTIPSEVSITSSPPDYTSLSDATFEFESNVPDSTFECKLDDGAWSTCSSPKAYSGLSAGDHTFSVRATGPSGNPGGSTTYGWFVVSEIDTFINQSPAKITGSRDATFTFVSGVDYASFECKLDDGAWEDADGECSSGTKTYSGLDSGDHTFSVRAIEAGGEPDPSPATYSWCINEYDGPFAIGSCNFAQYQLLQPGQFRP